LICYLFSIRVQFFIVFDWIFFFTTQILLLSNSNEKLDCVYSDEDNKFHSSFSVFRLDLEERVRCVDFSDVDLRRLHSKGYAERVFSDAPCILLLIWVQFVRARLPLSRIVYTKVHNSMPRTDLSYLRFSINLCAWLLSGYHIMTYIFFSTLTGRPLSKSFRDQKCVYKNENVWVLTFEFLKMFVVTVYGSNDGIQFARASIYVKYKQYDKYECGKQSCRGWGEMLNKLYPFRPYMSRGVCWAFIGDVHNRMISIIEILDNYTEKSLKIRF